MKKVLLVLVQEHRLQWTDLDWAAYLGCTVDQVQQYKQILNANLIHGIKYDPESDMYTFGFYRAKPMSNGGRKIGDPVLYSDRSFPKMIGVVHTMNLDISKMELPPETAKQLQVPPTAIQMMLTHPKGIRSYGF